MQNVHRIHRHVAQQKGLNFKMEISADVPAAIVTDSLRLQQLLRNLLSNAIKFTYEGSVTLRIRRAVSGWRYGNPALSNADTVIAFDVVDTGVGIAQEQQSQIFEAFGQSQNQPTREYGGTGLGLTISSEIAALLGGELALTSVPRQGSTFTLFLPLTYVGPAKMHPMPIEAAAAKSPASPEAAEPFQEVDPLLAGKTILVVDDDQRSRLALAAMLEKQQMRVLSASGGVEALEMLGHEEVDVVVMDVMMPVMDGYRAVQTIRSELGQSRLPVIALTADAMPATREACLAAGYSDYLSKPASNSELLARLHEWLERSAAPVAEGQTP
jgi:CheY-like chemotaxis protein